MRGAGTRCPPSPRPRCSPQPALPGLSSPSPGHPQGRRKVPGGGCVDSGAGAGRWAAGEQQGEAKPLRAPAGHRLSKSLPAERLSLPRHLSGHRVNLRGQRGRPTTLRGMGMLPRSPRSISSSPPGPGAPSSVLPPPCPRLCPAALRTHPVEAGLPAELVALGSAEVVVGAEGLVERCYQVEEGLAAALVAQRPLLVAALTFAEPEARNSEVSGVTGTARPTPPSPDPCPQAEAPPRSRRTCWG